MKTIKTGSDFSGVGAFDQALDRLGINQDKQFACDMDKYARQTYIHNFGEPKYYPKDVYEREIPKDSLDIYMTSPPCQGFSMAGKREGSILFDNSHEFIQKNKPRFFIFENVKGLLSHEEGKTFNIWVNKLGGKSVNGNPVMFPLDDSVPYHIYHKVLNAKNFNIPQNRERVFIIGIRDDSDNNFRWPKKKHLTKRLKDVLESEVDPKYFLSDKMIGGLMKIGTPFEGRFKPKNEALECGNSVVTGAGQHATDNFIKVGFINQDTQASQVYSDNGTSPNICAGTHGYANGYIEIKSATENDSINFTFPDSETIRGRVGKGVAQTLDTACNQGVVCFGRSEKEKLRRKKEYQKTGKDSGSFKDKELIIKDQEYYDTLLASPNPKKEGLMFVDQKIRRLTPLECFRLMDFNESFKWDVSDTQAYKQAGNSICVGVLAEIIKSMKI